MRWARKTSTPGRDASLRPASGNRIAALAVGLIVLVTGPLYYRAVFPQSVLATPAASAVAVESTPSPEQPILLAGVDWLPPATPTEQAAAVASVVVVTPTPTETSRLFGYLATTCAGQGRLSGTEIARLARAAGFPDAHLAIAVAVAMAESAGYPNATHLNTNGSTDFGVWQINTVHSALLAGGVWCVPAQNAAMAHSVWTTAGGSWTPWTTYNSGSYLTHLAVANQAAQALGAPAAPAPTVTPTGTPTVDAGAVPGGIAPPAEVAPPAAVETGSAPVETPPPAVETPPASETTPPATTTAPTSAPPTSTAPTSTAPVATSPATTTPTTAPAATSAAAAVTEPPSTSATSAAPVEVTAPVVETIVAEPAQSATESATESAAG